MDFKNIDYLLSGNDRQSAAFEALNKLDLFNKIKRYSPILTGTIPLAIDVDKSDLDVICSWKNKVDFISDLKSEFEKEEGFRLEERFINGLETILAKFNSEGFSIEIFGQNKPSVKQEAYLHLLIEHKILRKKGESFRRDIISLKRQGMKTEPAFAKLLELKGDPYKSLLDLNIDLIP